MSNNILVINGANLNMLGVREPEIYGKATLNELHKMIIERANALQVKVECFQSNHEGEIVERIHKAYTDKIDGIIINAGGYTHTSVVILDALKAVAIPVVEVHISDIKSRELFRRNSYISLVAEHCIVGKGLDGYIMALDYLAKK